jgi:hypothetical protein
VTHKFLGWSGAVGLAIAGALASMSFTALISHIRQPRRSTMSLAVATVTVVALAFVLIYPQVDTQVPGSGSDDDDAYNIGARALLRGHSPYQERTYLGNVLHPFAGSFLLAMPFVMLGTSAVQNLFWLTCFFVAVAIQIRDRHRALWLAWLVLMFSPTVMHQVVTGTGLAANTIYVLLGLWLLTRSSAHRDLAAMGWGVALASRANFLFLVPLAFGWFRQREGWRAAGRATAITCATVALLTLPFYFHDPMHYGPLAAADRVLRFDAIWPHAGEGLTLLLAALALGLATRPMTTATLFQNCALVQAFVPIAGTVLSMVQDGEPDLAYATYTNFATWFSLMSYAIVAMDPHAVTPPWPGNSTESAS